MPGLKSEPVMVSRSFLPLFFRASFVDCDHIEPMPSKSALPSDFRFVLRVPAARYASDSSESST